MMVVVTETVLSPDVTSCTTDNPLDVKGTLIESHIDGKTFEKCESEIFKKIKKLD